MTVKDQVIRSIEEQAWIDRAADPIQAAVRGVLDRAPALADVLHGRFLGHPLHPALIAVPVGAWTIAAGLDLAEVTTGTRRFRRSADLLTGVGLGGAVVAAAAGIADWSLTRGATKRVGFVHAAVNDLVMGLYGLSLYERSRRRRGAGIALAAAGFVGLGFSAWLGGELSFRFGAGVRLRPEAASDAGAPADAPGGEHVGEARTGGAPPSPR
jgi:uncharacterized membrane protein